MIDVVRAFNVIVSNPPAPPSLPPPLPLSAPLFLSYTLVVSEQTVENARQQDPKTRPSARRAVGPLHTLDRGAPRTHNER